ncbi:MAG: molybdopterin molybdotransferase MoeA [Lentisphaeraceae bacterium]|nr:molybdopterin molybdotransferase MoeA [Lentisphaeraceae bacterium]
MVSVPQANDIILQNLMAVSTEGVNILESSGRILAESVFAERDYPPFNRVTMDGIGIKFDSYKNGRKSFKIVGTHSAGAKPPVLTCIDSCYEVMTGSVAPEGIDCVIPVELLRVENGVAEIVDQSPNISKDWNIHQQASDCPAGTELLKPGLMLDSTSIAVAVSEGKETVLVKKKPRIAVVSSGDELVGLNENPKPWQIRRSNSYAIASELEKLKLAEVEIFHIVDDKEDINKTVSEILQKFDSVILSGAVSKGKFDFIPGVLEDLKVEKLFHHVSQRPGKPFWFGKTQEGKPVFALPGNPVSAITGFRRYIIPNILKSFGIQPLQRKVRLTADFSFKKSFTYFLPVTVAFNGAVFEAEPKPVNGSGDFSALALTDGFVELPAELETFPAGFEADYYPWNEI